MTTISSLFAEVFILSCLIALYISPFGASATGSRGHNLIPINHNSHAKSSPSCVFNNSIDQFYDYSTVMDCFALVPFNQSNVNQTLDILERAMQLVRSVMRMQTNVPMCDDTFITAALIANPCHAVSLGMTSVGRGPLSVRTAFGASKGVERTFSRGVYCVSLLGTFPIPPRHNPVRLPRHCDRPSQSTTLWSRCRSPQKNGVLSRWVCALKFAF